jgi:hypothetical protein
MVNKSCKQCLGRGKIERPRYWVGDIVVCKFGDIISQGVVLQAKWNKEKLLWIYSIEIKGERIPLISSKETNILFKK